MPFTRGLILVAIVVFSLTLTGCLETSSFSTSEVFRGLGTSQPIANSLDEMPADTAQSTRCIANSLSGFMCTEPLNIDSALKQKLHQTGIIDPGFIFHSATLMTLKQDSKNPALYTAQGQMIFEDALQRRIVIDYSTKYKTGDSLKITAATTTLAAKVQPESICFIIKNDDLALDMNKLPSFVELYRKAGNLAINPVATQNAPEQEYIILVFFMDKTTPSAKMHLRLSETSSDAKGFEKSSRYLNYNNGWRVGLVKGKINLLNPMAENSLYLKAVYTPGKEAGFIRTPQLVGLYPLIKKNKK